MSADEDMHASLDVSYRLEKLEQYVAKQGESISTVTQECIALKIRLVRLEDLAQSRAITEAREDERDKALYDRLDRMEGDIKSIKGLGFKALGVVGAAIALALVSFLIKGGFAP
jgi:hypothetical protein